MRKDNGAMTMIVFSVNVPRPAGASDVLKLEPASGPVAVGLDGLAARADIHPVGEDPRRADDLRRSHALYAYPSVHLPFWRTVRAQAGVAGPEDPIPPGSFDEHLALDGIQESQLWQGDLLRFANCTLAVTVPRLPDHRFDQTLGFPHAARMVAQSRWCGFWLAVRVPGTIAAGESFELVPGPREVDLQSLFRAALARQR